MTYPQDADVETPLEDAAEQATSAVPEPSDDEETEDASRVVDLDDEYR